MKHKTAWAKALPLLLLFLILTLRQTALAADYRVAFSDPTVIVGNEVTVNVHVSPACAGYSLVLYYDSNYLQFLSSGGGSNLSCNADETTIRLFDMVMSATEQEFRCTLTFKAKQIGRTTISITEASVSDNSGNEVEPTNKGTSVVTINAQPTYSSEARLSSLTLRPGNLSPAFSPDTYDYRVTVDSSTTSLTASYTAMESHATVSMPSFTDLKVGENSFRITVTAQDGTTKKTYRIVVVRQAPPETQPQPTQPTQPPTEPPTEAPTEPPATEPQEVIFSGTAVELTLLDFPIGFSIPEGYRLIHAMAANGVLYERLEPVGVEEVNHYLLYGVTGDGRTALYRYDLIEKTLQRYGFEILAEGPASEPGGEPADDSTEETQESSGEDTTEEPDTGSLSVWGRTVGRVSARDGSSYRPGPGRREAKYRGPRNSGPRRSSEPPSSADIGPGLDLVSCPYSAGCFQSGLLSPSYQRRQPERAAGAAGSSGG